MIAGLIVFYLIFVLVFVIYSIAAIYHLLHYGYAGDLTKPAAIIYVILSVAIILVTLILLTETGF